MMKIKTMCAAAAALALVVTTASAQNLLTDPGFQTGTGWTYFGEASPEDWANGGPGPYGFFGDGTLGVALKPWNSPPTGGGFGGVFQTIPVTAGTTYWAGYEGFGEQNYSGAAGGTASATATVIKFEWFDSFNIPIGTPDSTDIQPQILANWVNDDRTDPNNWDDYSASAVAPAGAVTLNIVYAGEGFANVSLPATAFTFDNAWVSTVPEPTTAALALLGLAGLAYRRRLNR